MPRFFFNVETPGRHTVDLVGKRCANLLEVDREARRIAAEMVSTSLIAGRCPDRGMISVEDEDMRPVLEMPLSQVAF